MQRLTAMRPLLMALSLILLFAMPAAADHGSWTHHDNVVFESGPSNYGGYATVDASDAYDFGHAEFEVHRGSSVLVRETVTCYGPNEGCGYRKTVTRYWSQSSSKTYSTACANDGSHRLSGVNQLHDPCSPRSNPLHKHTRTLATVGPDQGIML